VIAGKYRGQRLVSPKNVATRPTADRVRQALFDVLSVMLADAVVLDLYAGTGALGIEALSRGAAHAVLVEEDALALQAIRANLEKLGLLRTSSVLALQVERSKKRLEEKAPFDLVLCDPPWDMAEHVASSVLGKLLGARPSAEGRASLLNAGARVVLEHSARKPIDRIGGLELQLIDQRNWGDTAISIFA